MKNLMIFIHPRKGWDSDYNTPAMVELQCDCTLDFWKPEDVLFVTNFPYEYRGIKTLEVDDSLFCNHDRKATKINTIIYLIENGYINDVTWFHDIDAFPIRPFDLRLDRDAGFTQGGYTRKWNTGSIFFKPGALDVFKSIQKSMYEIRRGEEPAFLTLTDANTNDINDRYEVINNTYNVGMTKIHRVLRVSEKPIKVVHFPPHWEGKMEMYKPILTQRFIDLVYEKYPNLERV